jgi:Ca-activated chloride channel family protein
MRRALALGLAAAALALGAAPGAHAQGTGKPIVGGGSFNTAPLIKPGTYSDTVVAGERNFYRVRLEKGQQMEVHATVDATSIERDVVSPGYDAGLVNLSYNISLWSPIREPLEDEIDTAGTELEGDDDVGLYTGTASTRRTLGYAQVLASDFSVQKFEAPGDYYMEIAALESEIYGPPKTSAEFPVEFDLKVIGRAEASSPDFAQQLSGSPPPPSGGGGGATPDTGVLAAGSADNDSEPILVIAIFAAFALLTGLALGAVAALVQPRGRAAS